MKIIIKAKRYCDEESNIIRKDFPHIGDKRTITRFLFFPTKIGREIRWLETVSILQEYDYDTMDVSGKWFNIKFLNIKEKENNG